MFVVANNTIKEAVRPSTELKAEFAISFCRLPDRSLLLCKHDIDLNAMIGKGRPIPFSALCEAVDAIKTELSGENNGIAKSELTERSWTGNLLFESNALLIWYRPASNKAEKLWFRINEGICIAAKLPTLIFAFYKKTGELKIFASTSKTVTRKTELYHAPLCNIGQSGSLCFGSAEKPNPFGDRHSIIQSAEKAVLESMFSHVSHKHTFASIHSEVSSSDHVKIWQSLSAAKTMPKAKDMVKTGFIVDQLVGGLSK